jgi:hypothetical protein
MANSLRSKEDGVIKIHVRFCTVTQSFARVEDKWDIDSFLFLALAEAQQRFNVINQRFEFILVPNQIKSYEYAQHDKAYPIDETNRLSDAGIPSLRKYNLPNTSPTLLV